MILIVVIFGCGIAALAEAQPSDNADWQTTAQSIIGSLDYVAIDYPQAVRDGAVINDVEYAEQREFLVMVNDLLTSLPPRPERESLISQAESLASMIDRLAPGKQVESASRMLVAELMEAYAVVTAPAAAPNPSSVIDLYAAQCSSCHGVSGQGDGIAGAALDPPPTNFHDAERAEQRSLYGLYSTVTLGVAGTGMPPFTALTENQRWALAFYVAGFGDDPAAIAKGEELWREGVMRESLPTLASFTARTPAAIVADQQGVKPLLAYLRHHPEALVASAPGPLQRTIEGLRDVLSAYNSGRQDAALQLALSAYLEGYELVEASLRTIDTSLAIGIERDMQVMRNLIRDGVPAAELATSVANLELRLQEASALLSTSGSSAATIAMSAFLILLREGLEAILLLAAMSLYLRRTDHSNAMRYLHVGWLGALAAGALTWVGIKTVITISGAQREVVEGTAALLAAFVLLYVGIWLHRHSTAKHWEAFINKRLGLSLSTGTLWGIAGLAFVAVYRELLEIVLFFETLWLQSGSVVPLLLGAGLAAAALFVAGWIVFRIGGKLPLRRFFQANGILMFVLAVTFAGKGVAALQEAGWIKATFLSIPRIDWLGIYPTAQTVGAQLAIVAVGAFWLTFMSRRESAPVKQGT